MAASKKGLRLVGIALLAVLVLPVLAQVIVGRIFSERYLEELLEKELNAAVEVAEVKVSLFAKKVTLQELSLKPKTSSSQPNEIYVQEVVLGVKALPLFFRRLETTRFVISQPKIRMSLDKEGDLSVAELFSKPEKDGKSKKEKEKKKAPEKKKDKKAKKTAESKGVLEAKENRWLATLGETRLENGSVEMLFEKEKLQLKIEGLNIEVKDLQFDPEDLATLNQVDLNLAARATLFDAEGMLLVNLDLSGVAQGKLFNEETGDFDADVLADLALGEDSYLNPQVKIVRKVWSYLDRVEKVGIPLGKFPERIGFGRSGRIVSSYRDDQVTLAEPLSLNAGKWEVGLARDSWIATENGQHEIGVEFLAGEKVSQTLGGWFGALPKEAQGLVQNRFVDENQVLWRINSSGDLSDPKFDFLSQLPEAKGLLKDLEDSFGDEAEKLRDKAKGLLKGLFD